MHQIFQLHALLHHFSCFKISFSILLTFKLTFSISAWRALPLAYVPLQLFFVPRLHVVSLLQLYAVLLHYVVFRLSVALHFCGTLFFRLGIALCFCLSLSFYSTIIIRLGAGLVAPLLEAGLL